MRIPGIGAEGGGTNEISASATGPPCWLVTRPFTDEVWADATQAITKTTMLVIPTLTLCIVSTFSMLAPSHTGGSLTSRLGSRFEKA